MNEKIFSFFFETNSMMNWLMTACYDRFTDVLHFPYATLSTATLYSAIDWALNSNSFDIQKIFEWVSLSLSLSLSLDEILLIIIVLNGMNNILASNTYMYCGKNIFSCEGGKLVRFAEHILPPSLFLLNRSSVGDKKPWNRRTQLFSLFFSLQNLNISK